MRSCSLGFSYGGCVVTGSLEHIAERVRHLVYLDAFVPGDGESLASLAGCRRPAASASSASALAERTRRPARFRGAGRATRSRG